MNKASKLLAKTIVWISCQHWDLRLCLIGALLQISSLLLERTGRKVDLYRVKVAAMRAKHLEIAACFRAFADDPIANKELAIEAYQQSIVLQMEICTFDTSDVDRTLGLLKFVGKIIRDDLNAIKASVTALQELLREADSNPTIGRDLLIWVFTETRNFDQATGDIKELYEEMVEAGQHRQASSFYTWQTARLCSTGIWRFLKYIWLVCKLLFWFGKRRH